MGRLRRARREGAADFYVERLRPEFKAAFDAWMATEPLSNPDAPLTPFAMPVPRGRRGRRQTGRNYVLSVVMFAVALFFAGMSTKLTARGLQLATLLLGWTFFIGSVAWIATFPVSLSV